MRTLDQNEQARHAVTTLLTA